MRNEKIMNSIKEYLSELDNAVIDINADDISRIVGIITDAHKNDRIVFIMGNGGSAATAAHWSCDLAKGTVKDLKDYNEKRMKVIALTSNVPSMTAISNDIGYEEVFSQQLLNLMSKGDVLIAISASGNSDNIIHAAKLAKQKGLTVVGLIGFDGGKLKEISDHSVIIRSNSYGVVEDLHHIIGHIIHYSITKNLN